MSRTKNSIKNIYASMVGQLLTVLLQFAVRSVFIDVLDKKYLGVNGLFSNILALLSLAELGVGSAIIYSLYKPIADNDQNRILLLMTFYKKCYFVIGALVAFIGVCLNPFLPMLIKDDTSFINVPVIFLIYLLQSVSTYWFSAYKSALIRANQKEYILTYIGYFFTVTTSLVQIIVLKISSNFTFYIGIVVLFNILQNLFCAEIANRMYPFLQKKSSDKLSKGEKKEIFKNCYAIFIYRINNVVVNATDNMVLAAFIGLEVVGIYSNYLLIFAAIKSIANRLFSAMTASLGNLHADGEIEREERVFRLVNFISFWLFGIAAIGVSLIANDFIKVWIGPNFVLSFMFSLLIGIEIYIDGLKKLLSTFRQTTGLFQQAKYRPVAGIIINLAVSIGLVQYIGIYGVVIGTIVADLSTYMWYDPYIIYKKVFGKTASSYFKVNFYYLSTVLLVGLMAFFILSFLPGGSIFFLVLRMVICVLLSCLIFAFVFAKTDEFDYVKEIVARLLKK